MYHVCGTAWPRSRYGAVRIPCAIPAVEAMAAFRREYGENHLHQPAAIYMCRGRPKTPSRRVPEKELVYGLPDFAMCGLPPRSRCRVFPYVGRYVTLR